MMSLPFSSGPCVGCGDNYQKENIEHHIMSCQLLHSMIEHDSVEALNHRIESLIPEYVDVGPFPCNLSHRHTHHHGKRDSQVALKENVFVPVERVPAYLLLTYSGPYWMVLLVPKMMKLHYLDRFLRRTWVECCHHLSRFDVNQQTYHCPSVLTEHEPRYGGEIKIMTDYTVQDILPTIGTTMEYTYDFGTPTWLNLEVFGEGITPTSEEIFVLARNRLPVINCGQCIKNPATWGCTWCCDCLCKTCTNDHDCHAMEPSNVIVEPSEEGKSADQFVEIFNSPRSGTCMYCGVIDGDYYADMFD